MEYNMSRVRMSRDNVSIQARPRWYYPNYLSGITGIVNCFVIDLFFVIINQYMVNL